MKPAWRYGVFGSVMTLVLSAQPGPTAPSQAREAAQAQPRFDVASVKPTQHGRNGEGLSISYDPEMPSPGSFRVINNSLEELIRWAYRIKHYQIVGPQWLNDDSASFDIEAKMDPTTSRAQVRLMLQALLEDRFKLTFHRETRSSPVYELLPAKGGPKMAAVKPGAKSGISYEGKFWSTISAEKTTAGQLASLLSDRLDRPVLDKTGIEAPFAVRLEYRIDENDTTHPSLFGALQETMGLRLQPGKGPVEVLVIDRIEKAPSEN
ncbi:MAG TPA: TIGR03435 family protein [Bryobacteraceae bacterium]|nr:TIGR03435 family protein [Bryobacteraceae bacterium]